MPVFPTSTPIPRLGEMAYSPAESAHPELWTWLGMAYVPALGIQFIPPKVLGEINPNLPATLIGSPSWKETENGIGLKFNNNNPDGWYIEDEVLPNDFPGKNNNPNNPYTMLAWVRYDISSSTHTNNTITKQSSTSAPYFLWEQGGLIKALLDVNTASSTTSIIVGKYYLVGSIYDLSSLAIVVNGKIEGAVSNTNIRVGSYPNRFRIGHRGDLSSTRCMNGILLAFYWYKRPLKDSILETLASDPLVPFRRRARLWWFGAGQPVSNSFIAPYEFLQGVNNSRIAVWEALGGVASSPVAPWESLQAVTVEKTSGYEFLQGVTNEQIVRWESLQGVAKSDSSPWEAAGAVSRSDSPPYEWLQRIETSHTTLYELLQGVAKSTAALYEFLQGAASEKAAPWEATGRVSASVVTPYEWLQRVEASYVALHEFLQGVSRSFSSTLELLQGLSPEKSLPWESVGFVSSQPVVPWEALVAVLRELSLLYESLQGVSSPGAVLYENLRGLAPERTAPWEAIAPVSVSRTATWESLTGVLRELVSLYEALQGVQSTGRVPWEAEGEELRRVSFLLRRRRRR